MSSDLFLTLLGLAFAVLALVTGYSSSRPGGRRGMWLALWCAALGGGCFWLGQGGTVTVPRTVLVVTATATDPDAEDAIQALREKARLAGDVWEDVAWATLDNPSEPLRWNAVHQAYGLGTPPSSADLSAFFQVDAIKTRSRSHWKPTRPTLLIVLDTRHPEWTKPVTGSFAPPAGSEIDMLVWDQRFRPPFGSLELTLPTSLTEGKAYDRSGSIKLTAPATAVPTSFEVKVANVDVLDSRNGTGVDALALVAEALKGPQMPQPCYFSTWKSGVAASGLRSPPDPSIPHFRYASVEIKLESDSQTQQLHKGGFIRYDSLRVQMPSLPAGDAQRDLRWFEQLDATQTKEFFGDLPLTLRSVSPAAPDIDIFRQLNLAQTLVIPSPPASTGAFSGLILFQPTLADLQSKPMEDAIKGGLSVLIIDPVAVPPATSRPAWLEMWPVQEKWPAPDADLRSPVVNTDARLYVLGNDSRMAWLALEGSDATAHDFQVEFLKALKGKLGSYASTPPPLETNLPSDQPPRYYDLPGASPPGASLVIPGPLSLKPAAPPGPPPPTGDGAYEHNLKPDRDVETEAEHVGLRLDLLRHDHTFTADSRIPRLNLQEKHTNTHVVIFRTDVPQPLTLKFEPGFLSYLATAAGAFGVSNFNQRNPGGVDTPTELKAFTDAGIKVHIITVETGLYEGAAGRPTVVAESDTPPLTTTLLKNHPLVSRADVLSPAVAAKKLAAELVSALKPNPSTITAMQFGQVVDQRVQVTQRSAPWRYTRLGSPAQEVTYAVVSDSVSPADKDAIICSTTHGRGRVVVMGYHPMSMDMWLPDSLKDVMARRLDEDAQCTYPRKGSITAYNGTGKTEGDQRPSGAQDGWGVQRLVDFVNLSCVPVSALPALQVSAITYDEPTGRLMATLKIPVGTDRGSAPKLDVFDQSGGAPINANISPWRITVEDQSATYALGPAGSATDQIILLKSGGMNLASIDCKGLPTKPQPTFGQETARWAGLSGATFLPASLTEVQNRELWPAAKSGRAALAVLGVVGTTLVFMTAYRWRSLREAFLAWRKRQQASEKTVEQLPLDVDAALAAYGFNPGKAAPTRTAGDPVGWRPLEPSDPMMQAKMSDLARFTTFGQEMQLPMAMPMIRLKRSLRAFQAEVWMDLHPRLHLTSVNRFPTKAEVLTVALKIIARNVWSQGGVLRLRSLQDARAEFGPVAQGNLDDVQVWLASATPGLDAPSEPDKMLASDVEPGTRLYVLSDFALRETAYVKLIDEAAVAELAGVRLLRVFDETEEKDGSLHGTLPGLLIFDRSDWDQTQLAQENRRTAWQLDASLGTHMDLRLTSVGTRCLFSELLAQLEKGGMFDEHRRG